MIRSSRPRIMPHSSPSGSSLRQSPCVLLYESDVSDVLPSANRSASSRALEVGRAAGHGPLRSSRRRALDKMSLRILLLVLMPAMASAVAMCTTAQNSQVYTMAVSALLCLLPFCVSPIGLSAPVLLALSAAPSAADI